MVHGSIRQVQYWQNGDRPRHLRTSELSGQVGDVIMGTLAEMAVSKFLGLYWSGVESQGAPDVGRGVLRKHGYEVRYTAKDPPQLFIRPHESGTFVLVTGGPVDWTIHGCYESKKAQESLKLEDPGGFGKPCYVISERQLEPVG
jgi:hypothetical protein